MTIQATHTQIANFIDEKANRTKKKKQFTEKLCSELKQNTKRKYAEHKKRENLTLFCANVVYFELINGLMSSSFQLQLLDYALHK